MQGSFPQSAKKAEKEITDLFFLAAGYYTVW